VAGRGLYPEAPQQAGDHKIVLLGRRGPQLRPRPAPVEEKHRRLRQLAYLAETYCPGSVPCPKAVGLTFGLRVRPADLEREVCARIIAASLSGSRPRQVIGDHEALSTPTVLVLESSHVPRISRGFMKQLRGTPRTVKQNAVGDRVAVAPNSGSAPRPQGRW